MTCDGTTGGPSGCGPGPISPAPWRDPISVLRQYIEQQSRLC
jgi:hypothetical protein